MRLFLKRIFGLKSIKLNKAKEKKKKRPSHEKKLTHKEVVRILEKR